MIREQKIGKNGENREKAGKTIKDKTENSVKKRKNGENREDK